MNSAAGDIARAFVDARRNWKTLAEYPGRRPTDLAGAYAIQGAAAAFVPKIIGSYSNVVGLPLAETAALLRGLGIEGGQAGKTPRAG